MKKKYILKKKSNKEKYIGYILKDEIWKKKERWIKNKEKRKNILEG
jgi:hypothetical protein